MPCGELPACTSTGCPCGLGTLVSGPRTSKKSPWWSMACTLAGSANRPVSRSRTIASTSTESHSAWQTEMNSSMRS